jgi:hypothetical protein
MMVAKLTSDEFERLLSDPMPAHAERLEEGLRGLWEDEGELSRMDRDRILIYLRNKKLTTPAEALLLLTLVDTQRDLVGRVVQLGRVFETAIQRIIGE